jgi:hypothetical protein
MNLKDAFGDFDRKGNMANARIVTRQDQHVAEMIEAIMADTSPEVIRKWPVFEEMLLKAKVEGEESIDRVIASFAIIGFLEVFKRLWEDAADES